MTTLPNNEPLHKVPVPDALIAALESIYPVKPPHESDSNRQIWIEVGRQQIIALLKSIRRRQNKPTDHVY